MFQIKITYSETHKTGTGNTEIVQCTQAHFNF